MSAPLLLGFGERMSGRVNRSRVGALIADLPP